MKGEGRVEREGGGEEVAKEEGCEGGEESGGGSWMDMGKRGKI